MEWIQKRYDQFILSLAAIALLVFSILLVLKTGSFADRFNEATAVVPPDNKIKPLVLTSIEDAKVALEKPPIWVTEGKDRGSLFVSAVYIIGEDGFPNPPRTVARKDSLTKQDIPNTWFMDHNLPWREASVTMQDPDRDGFVNEDEWREKTDPNNKDSHPAYHTKLFFRAREPVRFRLIFNAYNGDPKRPETLDFQINTLDLRQPSEFLKLGQMIPNTKYKLIRFQFKEQENPSNGDKDDVSELILMNEETKEEALLIHRKITNSPDVFGHLDYQWPPAQQTLRVKKLQEFVLKPQNDKRYKLIEIDDNEAVIQLPDGSKYTVGRDPRKTGR